ncbi:UEV domain-containing protein [Sparassis latifolia]
MAASLMHRWLRQNIQPYAHQDVVFPDVAAALARYPTLRPKTDVYTYDDGRTQLLLCLHGLVPISFRGAAYNIPVAVWLTREHPREPPIAYVVPTADMLVRPGSDVDVSGKCHIQYLSNWEHKPEGCNLTALFEAMQDAFSHLPPVYAKPKPVAAPQPTRAATTGPDYSDRPPPPLPPATPSQSVPPAPAPEHNDGRPPLPAKPGTPAVSATAAPHARTQGVPRSPTLLATLLRLHASVHARFTSELHALTHALSRDAERLRAQQADLLAGEPALRDEMGRLRAVRDVCKGVAARLRGAVKRGERSVAELRRKGDPEVDELVCSTTIVYNQLINLVAEDNAIEDTIYHLHRALNTGRIDLERFLRTTRVLAEEQFMKRALIEKIEAGLPRDTAAAAPWGVVPDFASWS